MMILAIGDIVGRPGRKAVADLLPVLRSRYEMDLIIANGENAAGGIGITPDTATELLNAGIDVLTSGNHIWAEREIVPYLNSEMPILRPLNYPFGVRDAVRFADHYLRLFIRLSLVRAEVMA